MFQVETLTKLKMPQTAMVWTTVGVKALVHSLRDLLIFILIVSFALPTAAYNRAPSDDYRATDSAPAASPATPTASSPAPAGPCARHTLEYSTITSPTSPPLINVKGDCRILQMSFATALYEGTRSCYTQRNISDDVAPLPSKLEHELCDNASPSSVEQIKALRDRIGAINAKKPTSARNFAAAIKQYEEIEQLLSDNRYKACKFVAARGEVENPEFGLIVRTLKLELERSNPKLAQKTKKGEYNPKAAKGPAHKAVAMALMTLAGMAFRRISGGMFPTGSTLHARLIGLGIFTAASTYVGGVDGLIAGLLMFPGTSIPTFEAITGGQQPGKTVSHDFAMNALRGWLQMTLPSIYLASRGYDISPMFLSGITSASCYAASNKYGSRWRVAQNAPIDFIDGGSSVGEVCSGGFWGAEMGATMVFGAPEEPKDYLGIGNLLQKFGLG